MLPSKQGGPDRPLLSRHPASPDEAGMIVRLHADEAEHVGPHGGVLRVTSCRPQVRARAALEFFCCALSDGNGVALPYGEVVGLLPPAHPAHRAVARRPHLRKSLCLMGKGASLRYRAFVGDPHRPDPPPRWG